MITIDWISLIFLKNIFSFQVPIDITRNEDPKVEIIDEYQHRKDWQKWKDYISTKLDLLEK